ncbi:hypothetical protein HNQ92_002027 [Rhabdobacter roseus]|uniref:Acyloxyacyl hydrolase n=1 Tax=Rhabdobacter roseus TaxID=1655419 RepID=A0A840TKB7_9BACT|nr:hypothetical protein [Rhabdobacter roseus]
MQSRATTYCLLGLTLLYLGTGSCLAQSSWEVLKQVGKLATRASERNTTRLPVLGMEVNWLRATSGEKLWQRAHGLPNLGLSLAIRNVGNPALYGYDASLVPFLEFNLLRRPHTAVHVRHGTGLGYVTRRHEPSRNPDNQLLSTHLNAASFLKVGLEARLGKYLLAEGGLDLRHLSNGNLFLPNLGLNTLGLYAGLQWASAPAAPSRPGTLDRRRSRWGWSPSLALGVSQQRKAGPHQFDWQLSTLAVFQHDLRFRALGGAEALFRQGQLRQVGILLGEEVLFGRLGVRYLLGGSVYNAFDTGFLYEKVGVAYYPFRFNSEVPQGMYVGTSIKAYGFRASFVEVSAGFVF